MDRTCGLRQGISCGLGPRARLSSRPGQGLSWGRWWALPLCDSLVSVCLYCLATREIAFGWCRCRPWLGAEAIEAVAGRWAWRGRGGEAGRGEVVVRGGIGS